MKCKICQRQAKEKGYCLLHLQAYRNIKEKYLVWMKASDASWRDYLLQIQKNSLTGEWAKEVAKHIIEEGQICQVK